MLKCKDAMKEYNDVFAYGSRFVDFTLRFPVSYKKSLQRDRVIFYDDRIAALQGAAIIAACEKERAAASVSTVTFPDLSEISTTAVTLPLPQKTIPTTSTNNRARQWYCRLANMYPLLISTCMHAFTYSLSRPCWTRCDPFRSILHWRVSSLTAFLPVGIVYWVYQRQFLGQLGWSQ